MKKALLGVLLCLSLAVFAFSGGFSIKVNGGANFLMGGDYNAAVEDSNAFWQASAWTVGTELKTLNMGWNFGAEFIYNITEEMGLGLGVGYLTASNDSTLTASYSILSASYNWKPSVSAIPITLNFHYFMPIGETMNFHFFAGPGLYISTFNLDMHITCTLLDTNYDDNFESDSKLVFGFQGGVGIEFAVSPNISLCVDVLGRYANLSGLSGSHSLSGTLLGLTGSGTFTNHHFYYFEFGGVALPWVMDVAPSGGGITNAREASVSLSGVGAQVGLKINI